MNATLSPTVIEAFARGAWVRRGDGPDRLVSILSPDSGRGHVWQLSYPEWDTLTDAARNTIDFLTTVLPSMDDLNAPYVIVEGGRSEDGPMLVEVCEDTVDGWADIDWRLSRSIDRAWDSGITMIRRNADGSSDTLYPARIDGVVAFVGEGELFCVEHGQYLVTGDDQGIAEGSDLNTVEWCGAFSETDHGHSFCGVCGDHLTLKGHPDSNFVGPFSYCQNCNTWAALTDDHGYVYVDDFTALKCTVTGVTVTYVTSVDGTTKVDRGVIDALPYRWTVRDGVRVFLAFLDADPSAGRVLVLATSWDSAYDDSLCAFEDWCENDDPNVSDDDHATFLRESLTLEPVSFDDITVTSLP